MGYWEARYRQGTSSSMCEEWNWDEEVCDRDSQTYCPFRGPNLECRNTMGFQRAWKWKVIGEAIQKHSPELVRSKTQIHSPPEPGAPIPGDGRSKRTIQDPVEVTMPENYLVLPKVVDVGCGDLVFWRSESLRLAHPLSWHTHGIMRTEEYVGIDIVESVITRNRRNAVEGWSFIASPAQVLQRGLKAPVVFCIDLLFHIMDDMEFIQILKNLCHYSEDLIIIHGWKNNPLRGMPPDGTTDGVYQKYRPLEAYLGIFMNRDFKLVDEYLNPNKIGGLYVFKRIPPKTILKAPAPLYH